MTTLQELADLQIAWLDTSQLPRANRRALIEPLLLSLTHLKTCRLPREEAIFSLCGKLLKFWELSEPPVAACSESEVLDRIQAYAERIYRYFDEECAGSLAHLTHRRESLEDGYHFLLLDRRGSRMGRPKELETEDYETISVAVRKDLLTKIKTRGKSRRQYIEELLIQDLRK